MSEATLLWIFGTMIGIQTTIIGALAMATWTHAKECRDYRTDIAKALAEVSSDIKHLQRDIGDHDSGLRGQVHKMAQDISPYIIKEQMRRKE